jgi:hypothetical protein
MKDLSVVSLFLEKYSYDNSYLNYCQPKNFLLTGGRRCVNVDLRSFRICFRRFCFGPYIGIASRTQSGIASKTSDKTVWRQKLMQLR